MQKEPSGITSHINAEEEVQRAEILEPKLRTETTNDVAKKIRSGGSDYNIINIEQKHSHMISPMQHEQRRVRGGAAKPENTKERGDALVPGAWRLFEAI